MSAHTFKFTAAPYSCRRVWFAWCSCRRWGFERQYRRSERSRGLATWQRHVGRANGGSKR